MPSDRVEQVLGDFQPLLDPDADPQLEAIKTALMLEDVFGVHLTDADIDPVALGDAAAIRDLLRRTQSPA